MIISKIINIYNNFTKEETTDFFKMIFLILRDYNNGNDSFIDYYLNCDNFINHSLIYKQIIEQTEPLNDIEQWKSWIKELYMYYINNLRNKYFKNLNALFKLYINYILLLKDNSSDEKIS